MITSTGKRICNDTIQHHSGITELYRSRQLHQELVSEPPAGYQTEAALEREFIEDLISQGYEYVPSHVTPDALLCNARNQLQALNNIDFTDSEWGRFLEEYLDKKSDSLAEKTKKIHDNYIYDFVFDDGYIQNIYLVDKTNIARNKVQVINQFGAQKNRYDVTILVNGMPMLQQDVQYHFLSFEIG